MTQFNGKPAKVRYEELSGRTYTVCPGTVEGEVSTEDPHYVHVDTDKGLVSIPIRNVIRIDWMKEYA